MITAVDVGATKTLIAQFGDTKKPINVVRFPTPEDQNVFLNELTQQLSELTDVNSLVVGIPGRAKAGVIQKCVNLPLWKQVPLQQHLASTYKCPILIENDANLAALAEVNALTPVPRVGLYITISTGIGTGLVLEGRLSPHSDHSMGHMVFHLNGAWQRWEQLASGRAITNHFGKLAQQIERADEWQWVAERIALGLCALIPAIRPEVIIFGGGVGGFFDKFKEPLQKLLNERLPEFGVRPKLLLAQHPNEAVLYGCYYYALHHKTL